MSYPRAGMFDLLKLLGGFLVGLFRSRAAREAEMAFLRQQLLVLPETLLRWHRSGFRLYWRWKSRRRVGRPAVPAESAI